MIVVGPPADTSLQGRTVAATLCSVRSLCFSCHGCTNPTTLHYIEDAHTPRPTSEAPKITPGTKVYVRVASNACLPSALESGLF